MYNSRLYNIIRLLACAMTLIALVGHYYLPKKTYLMVPNSATYGGLSSDGESGGASRASWIDQAILKSLCQVRPSDIYKTCSVSLSWDFPAGVGHNLSVYDGFRLKLNYEGPAERVRLYMRNYNPKYSTYEDKNSTKFVSMWLRKEDLHEEVFVKLAEFTVADWWRSEYNLSREMSQPEFGNVVTFGIDYLEDGDHILAIEKIEFVGDWIETEKLLLAIVLVWMALLTWEAASRLYLLNKKNKKVQKY